MNKKLKAFKQIDVYFKNKNNLNLINYLFEFLQLREKIRIGCITKIVAEYTKQKYMKKVIFLIF